jgi:hypothetical protein
MIRQIPLRRSVAPNRQIHLSGPLRPKIPRHDLLLALPARILLNGPPFRLALQIAKKRHRGGFLSFQGYKAFSPTLFAREPSANKKDDVAGGFGLAGVKTRVGSKPKKLVVCGLQRVIVVVLRPISLQGFLFILPISHDQ